MRDIRSVAFASVYPSGDLGRRQWWGIVIPGIIACQLSYPLQKSALRGDYGTPLSQILAPAADLLWFVAVAIMIGATMKRLRAQAMPLWIVALPVLFPQVGIPAVALICSIFPDVRRNQRPAPPAPSIDDHAPDATIPSPASRPGKWGPLPTSISPPAQPQARQRMLPNPAPDGPLPRSRPAGPDPNRPRRPEERLRTRPARPGR